MSYFYFTIFFRHFLLCVKLKSQSTELCLRLATNLFNFDTQPFANLSFRTRKLCVVRCFRLFFIFIFLLAVVVASFSFSFSRGDSFVLWLVALIIHICHICCLRTAFDYFSIYQLNPSNGETCPWLGWQLVVSAKYVSIGIQFDLTAGIAIGGSAVSCHMPGPCSAESTTCPCSSINQRRQPLIPPGGRIGF